MQSNRESGIIMRNVIVKFFFLTIVFVLGFSLNGICQNGSIAGTVVDSSMVVTGGDSTTKEPLIGVYVILTEKNIGTATDVDGKFELKDIPPGRYSVTINYLGYTTKTIPNVKVEAGKVTKLHIELSQDVLSMDEVVITATPSKNTSAAVINEVRNSDQVASGVSAEQISKSQDRDAAEVVKRVSGITVVDNRFVMVRGLSERYNTVLLNNAITPSSETDVKAFSFDIIPSSVIDRVIIYKSPSPEISGEFAGGVIKVYTKDIPDVNSFTIGYASSYRQHTTGKLFYTQNKGKYDWLGYDDGTYRLPKGFPEDFKNPQIDKVKTGSLLENNWLPVQGKAPVDHRFNIGLNRKIYVSDKVTLGSLTSLNYSNTNSITPTDRLTLNETGDTAFVYRDDIYTNSVRVGALQNFAAKVGAHNFEFKNLYSHLGISENTIREGKINNGSQSVRTQYLYKGYRDIYTGQVNGRHHLFSATKIEWTVGYSVANKDEPDFRIITQINIDPIFVTDIKTPNNPTYTSLGRLFTLTLEDTKMASVNLKQPIAIKKWGAFIPEVRMGLYLEEKKRKSSIRSLAYVAKSPYLLQELPLATLFSDKYLDKQDGLFMADATKPEWSYQGYNDLTAYYSGIFFPFTSKLNFYPGIRVERNRQQVIPKFKDPSIPLVDNYIISVLPSFNLNYNLSENSLIRAAYGKTINRPEFRELTSFSIYDFNLGVIWYGNPLLKTPEIHNFDFRYEIYPDFGETFSVGFFYKRFVNPIERVVSALTSGDPEFTYANAYASRSIGVEFEARKSFKNMLAGRDPLDDLYLTLNSALISSKVELPRSLNEVSDRPMAGQSPYIINAGLSYTIDSLRFDVSAVYNILGRRISILGNSNWPSVYEMPRHQLDITVSKKVGKYLEIKGGIADVFNARYQFLSDNNKDKKFDRKGNGDVEFSGFRRGTYYTLGIFFKL